MKKIVKVLLLGFALVSLIGFAGCKPTPTSTSNNGTNNSTKNPINNDEDEEIEIDENEPTKLFTASFKIDCQIWVDDPNKPEPIPTFELEDNGYATIIAGSLGWWGGVFCYDPKDDAAKAKAKSQTYDMSKVKKMTFKASAGNKKAQIKIGTLEGNAQTVKLSQDWDSYSINITGTTNDDFSVLWILGGSNTTSEGDEVYIGDITFLDENDNEVIPTCNYTE